MAKRQKFATPIMRGCARLHAYKVLHLALVVDRLKDERAGALLSPQRAKSRAIQLRKGGDYSWRLLMRRPREQPAVLTCLQIV